MVQSPCTFLNENPGWFQHRFQTIISFCNSSTSTAHISIEVSAFCNTCNPDESEKQCLQDLRNAVIRDSDLAFRLYFRSNQRDARLHLICHQSARWTNEGVSETLRHGMELRLPMDKAPMRLSCIARHILRRAQPEWLTICCRCQAERV